MNLVDRIGIIFTICFVDFMLVIIRLLSTNALTDNGILIIIISGIVLSIFGYISYRKNSSPKKPFILSDRNYILFFVLGVILGLFIRIGIGIAYSIDYKNTEPVSFYYGIPLALGGYAGLLFFTIMTMVVSVVNIPYIRRRIQGDSRWVPFVGGVALGFGIMAIFQLLMSGIPKLW